MFFRFRWVLRFDDEFMFRREMKKHLEKHLGERMREALQNRRPSVNIFVSTFSSKARATEWFSFSSRREGSLSFDFFLFLPPSTIFFNISKIK